MRLNSKIALSVYVAFAGMFFVCFCFTGWRESGFLATAKNWLGIGLLSASNAIIPTALVMLGVFSNKWFRWGFLPENRGKAKLKGFRS